MTLLFPKNDLAVSGKYDSRGCNRKPPINNPLLDRILEKQMLETSRNTAHLNKVADNSLEQPGRTGHPGILFLIDFGVDQNR